MPAAPALLPHIRRPSSPRGHDPLLFFLVAGAPSSSRPAPCSSLVAAPPSSSSSWPAPPLLPAPPLPRTLLLRAPLLLSRSIALPQPLCSRRALHTPLPLRCFPAPLCSARAPSAPPRRSPASLLGEMGLEWGDGLGEAPWESATRTVALQGAEDNDRRSSMRSSGEKEMKWVDFQFFLCTSKRELVFTPS
ncbi:hypothetical protein C2845_PM11G04550 [Panicum miliaceum]|uniref:Uncharacterized protein n=1 Tax=Panicum miliaceum TaxID=4540 RepID=A0A3L6RVQ6_PANMI|nr:hypothetical protein C2845_PM11G04550 [Panicum miliaceum]